MKFAKLALVATLSLSLTAAIAAPRKPNHNGGNHHSNSSHHSSNHKPSNHKPSHHSSNNHHNPVHHTGSHGCKAGDHFWGGGCHSYPKPISHTTHNHYGHAYSHTYTTYYPYYYDGYYYSSPWWHHHHTGGTYVGGGTTVDVTCSPETMTKNTFAAEAVLVGLAQNEMSENTVFTQKVADFQALDGAQKIEEGLRIAGVKNPKDAKEVMNLIYARTPSAESVSRVAENLNMNDEEATLVVVSVTNALKQR